MKSLKFKSNSTFIFDRMCWIKNKITGEVKWFESLSEKAEDAAAKHWAFFDRRDKMENLGNSFFDTKTYDSLDNAQIKKHQRAYLLQVSIKINKDTGVKGNPCNNITFEYLSSIFLRTSFRNNSNKNYELPEIIWGFGAGVKAENKGTKELMSFGTSNLSDSFISQNAVIGSYVASNDRARAINYFETKTKSYISNHTLFRIKQHRF